MQPWSARFLPGLDEGSVRLCSLPSQILIHSHEERSLWLWDPPTRLVLLLAKPLGAETWTWRQNGSAHHPRRRFISWAHTHMCHGYDLAGLGRVFTQGVLMAIRYFTIIRKGSSSFVKRGGEMTYFLLSSSKYLWVRGRKVDQVWSCRELWAPFLLLCLPLSRLLTLHPPSPCPSLVVQYISHLKGNPPCHLRPQDPKLWCW